MAEHDLPPIAAARTGDSAYPDPAYPAAPFGASAMTIGAPDSSFMITAKRVDVARKTPGQIRQALGVLCGMNADQYLYSWEVKDRKNNRTQTIEGLTIKAAMDLARVYGNCFTGVVDVKDQGQNWLLQAIFVDLETGFTLSRYFLQRKGQDTGMRDSGRAADLVFQIGQSKAIRNAALQANSSEAAFMLEESKKNMIAWVEKHSERANKFIDATLAEQGIALARVEAVIGRRREKWTVRDLTRVFQEMRGINDGMTVADEVYPSDSDAAKVTAEKTAKREEGKREEPATTAGKAADTPKTEAPTAAAGTMLPRSDTRLGPRVADLSNDFGPRTIGALKRGGLTQIGHVVEKTAAELGRLKGFGDTGLREVNAYLEKVGLGLGMKIEPRAVTDAPEAAQPPAGEDVAPEPQSEDPTPAPETSTEAAPAAPPKETQAPAPAKAPAAPQGEWDFE